MFDGYCLVKVLGGAAKDAATWGVSPPGVDNNNNLKGSKLTDAIRRWMRIMDEA